MRAVVEATELHFGHTFVDTIKTRPDNAVVYYGGTHVGVVRHFVEEMVVLAVLEEPFLALGALNERNVCHMEIVNAPDNQD